MITIWFPFAIIYFKPIPSSLFKPFALATSFIIHDFAFVVLLILFVILHPFALATNGRNYICCPIDVHLLRQLTFEHISFIVFIRDYQFTTNEFAIFKYSVHHIQVICEFTHNSLSMWNSVFVAFTDISITIVINRSLSVFMNNNLITFEGRSLNWLRKTILHKPAIMKCNHTSLNHFAFFIPFANTIANTAAFVQLVSNAMANKSELLGIKHILADVDWTQIQITIRILFVLLTAILHHLHSFPVFPTISILVSLHFSEYLAKVKKLSILEISTSLLHSTLLIILNAKPFTLTTIRVEFSAIYHYAASNNHLLQ